MKCPICNAENAPDASNCSQCGFSLSLSQTAWPDFPTLEIPEPVSPLQWPEPPAIEVSSAPINDTLAIDVESVEIEPVKQIKQVEQKEKVEATAVDAPPPDQPSDDELAREHIARGFEAIRQGMFDQARWELEQARDLADSEDISRLAQSQLDELSSAAELIFQNQPAPIMPERPDPIKTLSAILVTPADWASTTRTGAIAGAVNGLATLISAQLCCGLFLSPAAAFITGVLIARQASKGDQTSDVVHAMVAGGITGLGGWLGQVIGSAITMSSMSHGQPDAAAWPLAACLTGIVYIPVAIALGALGWKVGRPKQER